MWYGPHKSPFSTSKFLLVVIVLSGKGFLICLAIGNMTQVNGCLVENSIGMVEIFLNLYKGHISKSSVTLNFSSMITRWRGRRRNNMIIRCRERIMSKRICIIESRNTSRSSSFVRNLWNFRIGGETLHIFSTNDFPLRAKMEYTWRVVYVWMNTSRLSTKIVTFDA